MDCSNTSRYLYKVTTGILLPRTASDQYYYLHQQNKAWDVPDAANGFADCNYLRKNLKVGDLLFWENTYRPERQPPITHVMIFLGTNEKGQWIMAGSPDPAGAARNITAATADPISTPSIRHSLAVVTRPGSAWSITRAASVPTMRPSKPMLPEAGRGCQ